MALFKMALRVDGLFGRVKPLKKMDFHPTVGVIHSECETQMGRHETIKNHWIQPATSHPRAATVLPPLLRPENERRSHPMMQVGHIREILHTKGNAVWTIPPEA